MRCDCICIYSMRSFSLYMNTNTIKMLMAYSHTVTRIHSFGWNSLCIFHVSDSTIFSKWIFSWARNTHTELHNNKHVPFKEPLTTNHIEINNQKKKTTTHNWYEIDLCQRLDVVLFLNSSEVHRFPDSWKKNICESRYG